MKVLMERMYGSEVKELYMKMERYLIHFYERENLVLNFSTLGTFRCIAVTNCRREIYECALCSRCDLPNAGTSALTVDSRIIRPAPSLCIKTAYF